MNKTLGSGHDKASGRKSGGHKGLRYYHYKERLSLDLRLSRRYVRLRLRPSDGPRLPVRRKRLFSECCRKNVKHDLSEHLLCPGATLKSITLGLHDTKYRSYFLFMLINISQSGKVLL